jgi:hypothetical protein
VQSRASFTMGGVGRVCSSRRRQTADWHLARSGDGLPPRRRCRNRPCSRCRRPCPRGRSCRDGRWSGKRVGLAMRHCEPSPDVQLSVVRALPRAPCRTPTPDPRDAVSSTGSFRLTTAAAMAASAWESPCRDTTRLRAYASRRSGDGVCPSRPEDRTMSIHAPSPSAPSRARHGDPRLDTVG